MDSTRIVALSCLCTVLYVDVFCHAALHCSCVASMLRLSLAESLNTQQAALQYIGERLRVRAELPDWTSDVHVARYLLKYVCVYVHVYTSCACVEVVHMFVCGKQCACRELVLFQPLE